MGGRPIVCLNLVGFPSGKLEPEALHRLVAGALSKVTEAGAVLAGGHTTDDEEPKFGLAVAGLVHPEKYWANAGARPGDALILTKPVGSGVLFNANLKGWVSKAALDECLETITVLNKTAAEVLARFEVHAATDITGFGLAGHGLEMAEGSDAALRIEADAVPTLPEALAVYERGMTTGVNAVNQQLIEGKTSYERRLPTWHEQIFIDPQTSGGLLAAVPAAEADAAVAALREAGVRKAERIGTVEAFDGRYRLFIV